MIAAAEQFISCLDEIGRSNVQAFKLQVLGSEMKEKVLDTISVGNQAVVCEHNWQPILAAARVVEWFYPIL